MRHIASLFAGIFLAPLAWLLIGAAQIGLNPVAYEVTGGTPSRIVSMAMFVGAGVLLGLLAVSRLSPVGPILAGLTFIVGFAVFRGDLAAVHLPEAMTNNLLPRDSVIIAGDTGMVIVIGALLLMSGLFPSRWRGKKKETEPEREDLDTASLAGTTINPQEPAEPIDPFAASGTTRQLDGQAADDDRPQNPFDTPAQQYPAHVPEHRSPYADDGYGQGDYEYDADRTTAAQQRYSEQQRYGGYR